MVVEEAHCGKHVAHIKTFLQLEADQRLLFIFLIFGIFKKLLVIFEKNCSN